MAQIAIRDANGTQQNVEAPLAPGRAAASSSRPIALATEDKAALDLLHTDITTLLARLPGSLGPNSGLRVDTSGSPLPISGTVSLQDISAAEYETVAASQTAQVLGSSGGTGDYVSHILVVPATTSPGAISLIDGATSISVFPGGTNSVSNLVPFVIPIGARSLTGSWKITTGGNVSCIAFGNFT
jgi:hypothetical protein